MCNCIIPNIHVATRHYLYSLAFEGSLCLEQLHNKGLQEVITSCTVIIKPQKDVFESPDGRLIGEAEGKDNKAVNVDKLRQLQMNIHEDLLRDSVTTPAKPVLFGNAHRLSSLDQRGDPFTEKCVAAALTMNTALVFTPELFLAVQTCVECQDEDFAAACRQAILSSVGHVTFPTPANRGST